MIAATFSSFDAGAFLARHPELAGWFLGVVKSTAIAVAALTFAGLFRRRSAVIRCWILRLAFLALALALGPPLGSGWVPMIPVHFESAAVATLPAIDPAEVEGPSDHPAPIPEDGERMLDAMDAGASVPPPVVPVDSGGVIVPPVENALLERLVPTVATVYLCVTSLLASWFLLRNLAGLMWLRKRSTVADEAITLLCDSLTDSLGMRRAWCRSVPALAGPLLTGWFRARLWLPVDVAAMPEGRIRAILLHELAHHRRRDLWWQSIASLVCVFWWWHPLVWLLRRQLSHEAELAADEAVLSGKESATDYAELLVRMAAGWAPADLRKVRRTGVPMMGSSSIERRVRAILSGNPFRSRVGWAAAATVVLIGVAGLGLACLTAAIVPSQELPVAEEALTAKLIASLESRQAAHRFIHFSASEVVRTEDAAGGIKTNESVPSKSEAWMDVSSDIYRIEHRPRVSPWKDGAAPFYVANSMEMNDGKIYRSYEDRSEEPLIQGESRPPSPSPPHFHEKGALAMLRHHIAGSPEPGCRTTFAEKTVDGHRIVELIGEFRDGAGGVNQRETFHLDIDEPGMVRLWRMEFPGGDSKWMVMEWRLLESARNKQGIAYAKRYTRIFGGSPRSSYEYTLGLFEVLDGLPPGVTDPIVPQWVKYVVPAGGEVVRRDHVFFRFIDAASGKDIPSAKVSYRINRTDEVKAVAGSDGGIRVPLPAGEITFLRITSTQEGFSRHSVSFQKSGDPLQLPETYQVKLHRASPISGRVVAEDGSPISGATVRVSLYGQSPSIVFRDTVSLSDVRAVTDAKGSWKMEGFPDDLTGLGIRVSHPEYAATTDADLMEYRMAARSDTSSLRDGTSRIILRSGARMTGRIVDWKGNPVEGARVTEGKDNFNNKSPFAKTDAAGRFLLKGLPADPAFITVEAAGCRPLQGSFDVSGTEETLIRLQEPAVLRGRAVREDGTPCADLDFSVSSWNGTRTLKFRTRTDADGRFTWDGAPLEQVTVTFGWGQDRPDEFLSGYPITATAEEQTIVIKPALRVRATVVDDATGKPLAKFDLTPGYNPGGNQRYWEAADKKSGLSGLFEWKSDRFREGNGPCFLIEAEGYEPLETPYYPTRQQTVEEVWRLKRK